jgi:hypothetical protein
MHTIHQTVTYALSWTDTLTFHHDLSFIPLHDTYVPFIFSPQFTSICLQFISLQFNSVHFTSLGWFFPHFHFALFTTFLPPFLKLLGLQGRVPKASAGSWFQSWMLLFTKEYFPISVFCFLLLIFLSWSTLLRYHGLCNLSRLAFEARSPVYALKRAHMRAIFLIVMDLLCSQLDIIFYNVRVLDHFWTPVVQCYAAGDADRIVNSFITIPTTRNYNHSRLFITLLHIYTAYNLTRSWLQSLLVSEVLHHAEIVFPACRAIESRRKPKRADESRSEPSQQKGGTFILRCSATVGYTRYAVSTTIERTFSGGCTIEGYIRGTGMSKQSVV